MQRAFGIALITNGARLSRDSCRPGDHGLEKGSRHVRIPTRALPFAMLSEAPRRMTEMFLTGVQHQESVRS